MLGQRQEQSLEGIPHSANWDSLPLFVFQLPAKGRTLGAGFSALFSSECLV